MYKYTGMYSDWNFVGRHGLRVLGWIDWEISTAGGPFVFSAAQNVTRMPASEGENLRPSDFQAWTSYFPQVQATRQHSLTCSTINQSYRHDFVTHS